MFLTEMLSEINCGASFLDRLSPQEIASVRRTATPIKVGAGAPVFWQGDQHTGIFLIESGQVRTYYAGPSGKEITLALWTPGHFIGGPEVFGRGVHMWSAEATMPSRLAHLAGSTIRHLAETVPAFAVCLIEGLVAKGKCYSALAQMLGTRSAGERLAHLLLILAETNGRSDGTRLIVDRRITHEQLAGIIGATRQWVSNTLTRLQRHGIIAIDQGMIVIEEPAELRAKVW